MLDGDLRKKNRLFYYFWGDLKNHHQYFLNIDMVLRVGQFTQKFISIKNFKAGKGFIPL